MGGKRKFKQTKKQRDYLKEKVKEHRVRTKERGLKEARFLLPLQYYEELKTKIKQLINHYLEKEKHND